MPKEKQIYLFLYAIRKTIKKLKRISYFLGIFGAVLTIILRYQEAKNAKHHKTKGVPG